MELQALLDEDDSQTQKQLAEQLSVSQQVVSNRLWEMRKIQKVGRWVPHELNERQRWRGAKTHVKFYSNDTEESHSCIVSLLGMKSGFFLRKRKKSWVDPGAPSTSTALAGRRCSVFDETRRVWSIMSYWSLAKRLIPNAINNNWSIWTVRYLKNDQNTKRGYTRPFFSMTMLHHGKTSSGHVGSTQLRSSTPCGLFTRLGSFRLPLVCINGSRTCWAALWSVRRCEKMARWMVRGKRGRFLLT